MIKQMGIAALIFALTGCASQQQQSRSNANYGAMMVAVMQAANSPAYSAPAAQTKSPESYSRSELKAFIVNHSTPIRSQLENTSKGAEVDTLLTGLGLPDNEHETHIPVLQRIANRHTNDAEFAEAVLDYYGKQ